MRVQLPVSVRTKAALYAAVSVGAASALGFSLAVASYALAMQHSVLYGVSLGGVVYGRQSLSSLPQTITRQVDAIEHAPLSVGNTATTTTLADVGIHLDIDQAVRDVSGIGRQGTPVAQFIDTFSLLVQPKPVAWTVVASSTSADRLASVLGKTIAAGENASFALDDDGQLVIHPEHSAVTVDVAATLAAIQTSFLRGTPSVLYVQTTTQPAAITTADLASLMPTVGVITQDPITVTQGKKTVTASRADMVQWLHVEKQSNGLVAVELNPDSVTAWLDTSAETMNTKPVAQQVSSIDGSILRQGKEGSALDTAETSHRIITALQSTSTTASHTVQAVMTTVPVSVQTITPEHDTTAGLFPDKYVEVDLSSQMLYQYEGAQLIHSYRVSTGKASTPTPIGTFSIQDKSPRAYSATFGLYMPYWMPFIGSTYGLHALPQWPSGYTEGANHIGTPVSHGCVRLSNENAAALYDWAEVGTHVVIHR